MTDEEIQLKYQKEHICIRIEAFECLFHHPFALELYLWLCEEEKYFAWRLVPEYIVRRYVWSSTPFKKGKLFNQARDELAKYNLIDIWANKETSKWEYYQTRSKPISYWNDIRLGIEQSALNILYFTDEELKELLEMHPPQLTRDE